MSKKIIIYGFVGLSLLIFFVWSQLKESNASVAIASVGGASFEMPPNQENAYYLQYDKKWGDETLGGSGEPFASTGCLICALAMAGSKLGYEINPKDLNDRMKQSQGFTSQGWVIWTQVKSATDGNLEIEVLDSFNHSDLDDALQAGYVPVIKYFMSGRVSHWVPIVGKFGKEYLIKDSLDSDKRIVPLSQKTKEIASVRLVKKK